MKLGLIPTPCGNRGKLLWRRAELANWIKFEIRGRFIMERGFLPMSEVKKRELIEDCDRSGLTRTYPKNLGCLQSALLQPDGVRKTAEYFF